MSRPTVRQHFDRCAPEVRAIYERIVTTASRFGAFREDPKKTSIHLARKTAFAGVATRKDALILTVKSATDIRSARIAKRAQASARRWYLEIKLKRAADVDREVASWLKASFDLAGQHRDPARRT